MIIEFLIGVAVLIAIVITLAFLEYIVGIAFFIMIIYFAFQFIMFAGDKVRKEFNGEDQIYKPKIQEGLIRTGSEE